MARGPGFEPGLTAPKAAVLPLDDPRINIKFKSTDFLPKANAGHYSVINKPVSHILKQLLNYTNYILPKSTKKSTFPMTKNHSQY